MKRVVIVGGGVAGLATALHLKDGAGKVPGGLDVLVLERSHHAGGNIQTDRIDGFIIEKGPNGFLDNVPATLGLVRRLGLQDQLQKADEAAAQRFLFREGRLHQLPTGLVTFLKSPVLSLPGRLRVLAEPFAREKPEDVDETIFDFACRRIGEEAASVLIDAMVSGVFAGDVRALSLASSFPKMAAMEEEHGGLVRAMLARMLGRRRAKKEVEARRRRGEEVGALVQPGGPAGPGGTLTSFREGLDVLPKALARELGDSLRFGAEVVAIRMAAGKEGREDGNDVPVSDQFVAPWVVEISGGETFGAHAVVVALPSPRAGPILRGLAANLAGSVEGIETAGLAVVALAFDEQAMGGAPRGFGFLVPRGTGPRILGCLWDSSIFPGRAPEGMTLLRVMVGGAHDPAAVGMEEAELVALVRRDLRTTMGVAVEPLFSSVYRWPLGIGQYTVGHQRRLDGIHSQLRAFPGIWIAGSSYYGISMNACIERAAEQADAISEFLKSTD